MDLSFNNIQKKALRLYETKLFPTYFSGENLFPLRLRFSPITSKKRKENFAQVEKILLEIRENSGEEKDFGYRVEWKREKSKSSGIWERPVGIFFDTKEDLLKLIEKQDEYTQLINLIQKTGSSFPELQFWLVQHWKELKKHSMDWDEILSICSFVKENVSNLGNKNIREMQIPDIHTKFIETRKALFYSLFDCILEKYRHIEEEDFYLRFGFLNPHPLIRIRRLESIIARKLFGESLQDRSFSIEELENYTPDFSRVFIIENIASFLSFPDFPASICIFGNGYLHAKRIRNLTFLQNLKVYYWGDIDRAGFSILSAFREAIPSIESICMDTETFHSFPNYYSEDKSRQKEYIPKNLTTEEVEILQYLSYLDNRDRLEQEYISPVFLKKKLKEIL